MAAFLFVVLSVNPHKSFATHAAGAELTYRCLGGLVYQIDATFYRDCGGTPEPGNLTISYRSPANSYSRTVIANKLSSNNGTEITMPCNSAPSSCNGGFNTGLRKWSYRVIITLPFASTDWMFSYRVCCRNCTVTTIQNPCASNSELYVEAMLNNVEAACNNSPQFSNSPIAFVCLGQNFNYNQGVYDIDGDSLSYELITPKISASGEVSWVAPATQQSPMASSTPFTIDPINGDINFTPSALQIGILAVRVNEFRNGVIVGSTIRDMQVYTQNCFNSIPTATGINGTGNFTANVCVGQQLCFTISTGDVDSLQNVSVTYNNLPTGAVINSTPGSRPTLEFCWTPVQADANRLPKVFTITVRDDACPFNGVQTFSYTVFVGGPLLNITSTDPDCSQNNGSAVVSCSGTSGNTFLWSTSPPQTSATATGLTAGNYFVTVTDLIGCSVTGQVVINASPDSITVEATGAGNITCQSGNIGQASVSVTGGQSPYSYLWSNGSTASSVSGLGSGTYTVTVTDGAGCIAADTVFIPQSVSNMTCSVASISHVSCYGGNTGAVTITVSGGNVPYSFNWNNGATTSSVQNLNAGVYSVTVTDFNGCTAIHSVIIEEPQYSLSYNQSTLNHVSCLGGTDGSFTAIINGGIAPYSYIWSTGASTSSLDSLAAGIYTITVVDAAGCSISFSETIHQPLTALTGSIVTFSNIQCFGSNEGTIVVEGSGGTLPYSFLWNNGISVSTVTGVPAGNYSCIITDANGCSTSIDKILEEPELPVSLLATGVNHISCNQLSGSIDITGVGGTPPMNYLWNTGAVTQDLNNLLPGMYTVTATDANGCTDQQTIEIQSSGNTMVLSLNNMQNVLCFNMSNGSISVNVTGGNEPLNFQWNNGETSSQIQNLQAGTYTLTVIDASGCETSSSYSVTQPSAPLIPVISVHQGGSCSGGNSGTVSLEISGGTAPYSFIWSNGATSQNISGVSTGTYTVTVTDVNGCNAIISAEVIQPVNSLAGSISLINPVSCFGGNNGAASLNVNGGTEPYSFEWSNGSNAQTLSGVTAGMYTVTVTDAIGCTYSESITINQPLVEFAVTGATTNADCLGNQGGSIQSVVSGGTAPYTYSWSNGESTEHLHNVMPGIYSISITDANGCIIEKSFTVENSSVFELSVNGPLTICAGETVTISADSLHNGTYQWYYNGSILNGATGISFTTPAAGSYTVSFTNSCGEFNSDTVNVVVKSIGNVSVSNAQIICPPETATLIATGGVTYTWAPATYITFTNIADPIVSPQSTTVYSVEITNEFGCKTSLSTNVAVMCDSLLVPTGFSPNSDGVNDGYVIDGIEDYPGNKLWVYNRWGKLVFKATDYMNNWNGVSNISGIYMGKKVAAGTYYYILDLNDRSKPRAGYLIIRH